MSDSPYGGPRFGRWVARFTGIAVLAVVGLGLMSLVTFGWSFVKTAKFVIDLVNGSWDDSEAVVELLVVIETFLLAVVQVIIAVGLYELFIGDLDVPSWLEARSLDDLKAKLIDVLAIFVSIKGVERLVSASRPLDALIYAGASAALLVAISLLRLQRTGAGKT